MIYIKQFVLLIITLCVLVGCSSPAKEKAVALEYIIKVQSKKDRTNLLVTLKMASVNDTISFALPTDNYGTPEIHTYFDALTAVKGAIIFEDENRKKGILQSNEDGDIEITYTISYDPIKMEGSAFGPIVSSNYFSVAGCQWMLEIGSNTKKRNHTIAFDTTQFNGKVHSSIAEDTSTLHIDASYNDLISSRIGGGGAYSNFSVDGKPIHIYIKGDFEVGNKKIYEAIRQIVTLQRQWFNDYEQPFYNVVINQREGIIAGTAFNNQFVCFISPTISELELHIILAHEMFHHWLPNQIEIKRNTGTKLTADDYNKKYEWFSEGFTTYFAKRLLLDAKLISEEEFINKINNELIEIADSQVHDVTYEEIRKALDSRNFTTEYKNLAYWRGALMALIWEDILEQQNTTLSQYIRDLYAFANTKKGVLTEDEFYAFSKKFGIDAKASFNKHICEGLPIVLTSWLPAKIADKFILEEVPFKPFSPGFDIINSRVQKQILGVVKSSNAYKAGLRNGMTYLGAKNWYRGSNGWGSERQLIVTVKDGDKQKEITYIPLGTTELIQQFIKAH